jgi:hypothetical protein
VADGFRSGAAQFLSGLNVAVIREAFLPKDKSEPLSEVSAVNKPLSVFAASGIAIPLTGPTLNAMKP